MMIHNLKLQKKMDTLCFLWYIIDITIMIKTNLTSFDWLEAGSRKYAVANNQLYKTFKNFTLNI